MLFRRLWLIAAAALALLPLSDARAEADDPARTPFLLHFDAAVPAAQRSVARVGLVSPLSPATALPVVLVGRRMVQTRRRRA